MNATLEYLSAAGVSDPSRWLDAVQKTCEEFHIDTDRRLAGFLAQSAHESGGYISLEENLNYKAATLATCWPKRFAVPGPNGKPLKDSKGVNRPNDLALSLERKPELIANHVYSNRMGNGNLESGEGWKYRGRGLKQLTGKENYSLCAAALNVNLLDAPEKLLEPEMAARSAGWFWQARGCAALIDRDDFVGLTVRINGGTIGLEDRTRRYQAVLAAIRRSA